VDIDIDVRPDFRPGRLFPQWLTATVVKDGKITKHPAGVYPQKMAIDPVTKQAAIPYEEAEDLGFLKVDFLHLNVYQHFTSRKEIDELLTIEPDWTLLRMPSVWPKLFQLAKHGELLADIQPKDVETLADCMALIRPGKKSFIGLYKKDKSSGRRILFAISDDGYSFKKSHALAYALVVWLQLHLIAQGRL
jgi:DNA polymerase III alpha subunit